MKPYIRKNRMFRPAIGRARSVADLPERAGPCLPDDLHQPPFRAGQRNAFLYRKTLLLITWLPQGYQQEGCALSYFGRQMVNKL